ncbi:hypothetical protein H6G51_12805 [Limnothrix sp. FACHB-708]|uniref:hypothetical protein n=1 Tax=unclassified Limnothrix TaxID=2632864 RepID=UPI00168422CA|nr:MULTISPECIES: hypothetical protein [unclassified Limnothrix]MBD2554162.1 hypothetical protein [Limnothrix sp. FACHB-708]MBD2591044.1 hypothetical protein [Limnothrix sp. FACHB-406]
MAFLTLEVSLDILKQAIVALSPDDQAELRAWLNQDPPLLTDMGPERSPKSTGRSIWEALQTIGAWVGDDLDECLQQVRANRSAAQFDWQPNPFDSIL